MSVVNNAVDYSGEMFRHAHHETPCRQFVGAEMYGAAGANLHGGSPDPAQRVHHALDSRFVNARAGVALAPFSRARAFMNRGAVHEIVDMLIGETSGNGNGSDYAISGLAAVAGGSAAAIIESEVTSHALIYLVLTCCDSNASRFPRSQVRRWLRLLLRARMVCRW